MVDVRLVRVSCGGLDLTGGRVEAVDQLAEDNGDDGKGDAGGDGR